MTGNLGTIDVQAGIEIAEILEAFESSDKDHLLFDECSLITQPHLELLTNYSRTVTTKLTTVSSQSSSLTTSQSYLYVQRTVEWIPAIMGSSKLRSN